MSDYVPQNDDEREKLEQGYVRYQGKWLSKPAYENAAAAASSRQSKERADELAAHADFAQRLGAGDQALRRAHATPRPSCSSTTATCSRPTTT